jgi:phage antirepressor YoqD-like protein
MSITEIAELLKMNQQRIRNWIDQRKASSYSRWPQRAHPAL